MLIRMTGLGNIIASLIAAGAVAAGGLLGAGSSDTSGTRTALVIDAATARDGRELIDPRLRELNADVRLPRTAEEARTNVRYFAKLGDRVVVAGPLTSAAAAEAGVPAERVTGLTGALAAIGR
jgi:hypothetical protein